MWIFLVDSRHSSVDAIGRGDGRRAQFPSHFSEVTEQIALEHNAAVRWASFVRILVGKVVLKATSRGNLVCIILLVASAVRPWSDAYVRAESGAQREEDSG